MQFHVTERVGNLIGWSAIAALVSFTAIGILLFAIASRTPAHTDEQRATEIMLHYLEKYYDRSPQERELAKLEIVPLRTSKWQMYNTGLSMSLLGSSLLLGILYFKAWDIRRLRGASTPRTRPRLLTLAGTAWLTLLPASVLELRDEFAQDDLTPTMDAGHGSWVVFAPPFFATTLIVLTVVGRYVVLRNARLPANLWIWNEEQPYHSLIWTIFYGLLASGLTVLIIGAAVGSPWFLPSLMIGLYVVLSTRAAVLNDGQAVAADRRD
jgi:hypothetical protein